MKVPLQTDQIFKILSKGQFINANSSDRQVSELYNIIDAEDNFEILYDYFRPIQFILERGDGYFYFSRPETRVNMENKLRRAYDWIDILDFFKTYDNVFGVGYRFSPPDILVRLKTDAELETKLDALGRMSGRKAQHDILEWVLKRMSDDSFFELENEITRQYKVLSAFKYLEDLIMMINVPDGVITDGEEHAS